MEEVELDDGGDFLAAAREDDAVVAHLLICLSRSKACVPWHPQQPGEPSKPPPTWGRRRARSGTASEGPKREAGGASPATPLSWSGASGTSGSGSDDGWSTPLRPPKQRRQQQQLRGGAHEGEEPHPASRQGPELCHGWGEQIEAPPAKGTAPESSGIGCPAPYSPAKVGSSDEAWEPHWDSVVAATPVAGSPAAGSGSNKVTAVAAVATGELGPARSIAHVQPSRSRWTAEGATSMGFGRQGKKKTVLELRAMKDSLLREQEQLQKELGKQREIYGALLGENVALKKLESSLPSVAVIKPHGAPLFGEASSGEPQQSASERQAPDGVGSAYVDEGGREQTQCTSSSSSPQALPFRFDLNCIPDGDL